MKTYKTVQARCYRGVALFPASHNSAGIRWTAHVDGRGYVKADTLEGIKRLVRDALSP